jgi:hypothetical protein
MADGGQLTNRRRSAKCRGWLADSCVFGNQITRSASCELHLSFSVLVRVADVGNVISSRTSRYRSFFMVPKQYYDKTVTRTSEYVAESQSTILYLGGHCPYALTLTSINLNGQFPWIHFDRSKSASDQ